MIVPRNRLIFWAGAAAVPVLTLAVMLPSFALAGAVALAAMAALAVADAAAGLGRLRGFEVRYPEVMRLSKSREGQLQVEVRNHDADTHELRLGLPLPPEITTPDAEMVALVPGGGQAHRVTVSCLPLRRGRFEIRGCHLERESPLGLWAVRGTADASAELRVYPNLMRERRRLSALFMNRGAFGVHAMRQVGKGREFEKLREYVHGDSYDEIHWKATARRGRPISKVFQLERTQEVYVVVDASRLSGRTVELGGGEGMETVTTLERFVTASLVLGIAAERQGDLFGVLSFGDRMESFVRARNGRAHYGACRDALYALEPRDVTPDFDEVCSFIRLRMRRRALLVFLTALDDPVLAESFVRNVELIGRQHLVLVNMVAPPGTVPLFTGESPGSLDGVYGRLGGHLRWHSLRELEKVLKRRGVGFSLLDSEEMCAQLVTQYMGVKQRQLL
jgi:uncharacterized protein (DUF58 family)